MLAKETRWAEGEAEMQCTPRGSEEPLGCSGAGHPQSCHERNGTFIPPYQPITGARQFSSVQFSSVAQSCPTLCDSIDGSPPGVPVPGILQARTLEWVAISFSNA